MTFTNKAKLILPVTSRSSEIENPYSRETNQKRFGLLRKFLALNILAGLILFYYKFRTEYIVTTAADSKKFKESTLENLAERQVARAEELDLESHDEINESQWDKHIFSTTQSTINLTREIEIKEKSEEESNAIISKMTTIPASMIAKDKNGNENSLLEKTNDRTVNNNSKEEVHRKRNSNMADAEFISKNKSFTSPEIVETSSQEDIDSKLRNNVNLAVWLKADSGIHVSDEQECKLKKNSCHVNRWMNQASSGEKYDFVPSVEKVESYPILLENVQNNKPSLFFKCPMVNTRLHLHDYMTLFFIISPAILDKDSEKGQTFFGNSPYGQFRFHVSRPSFFTTGGNMDSEETGIDTGEFSLITYRFNNHVEIGIDGNGLHVIEESKHPRFSDNGIVSLGSSKHECDEKAFTGRISEVMVYSIALEDDSVKGIEQYLLKKWFGKLRNRAALDLSIKKQNDRNTEIKRKDEIESHTKTGKITSQLEMMKKKQEVSKVIGGKKFDYETVFDWTPPPNANPSDASQWNKAVKEKIQSIQAFQLGGSVLHKFIRGKKKELNDLREEIFSYL